ncbi:MAG: hypothetical protein SFY68_14590 [Candidatus Sumerlaeia bacterium]|nr:hypothetical protein [Candidatus Sumerlaeia bacterium]
MMKTVFLTALFGLFAGLASAALVVPLPVEDLYAASKSVVHGEVVERNTSAYKNKIYTVSTIAVKDVFKGGKTGAEVEVIEVGGSIGPITAKASGLSTLKEGEEVIVFLSDKSINTADKSNQQFDANSPFVNYPMVMAGTQGKFFVKRVQNETTIGNKTITSEKAAVLRGGVKANLDEEKAPTLAEFTTALRTLEARVSAKTGTTTKSIAFVGEVTTLPRQMDLTALRTFDPEVQKIADYAKNLEKAKADAEAAKSAQPAPVTAPEPVQASANPSSTKTATE